MANYIDISYFVGKIDIPNTDVPGEGGANALELFIKQGESDFLSRFLGVKMYLELLSNTTFASPITGTGVWNDLIQGVEFTDSVGIDNVCEGLTGQFVYASSGFKRSPIANYVYWEWMRQNSTQTVGIGEGVVQAENMRMVSPAPKMVRAWNEMVDWLWILHDYLVINKADFPNYIGLEFQPLSCPTYWNSAYPNYHVDKENLNSNQRLFIKQNNWGI